jgi:hypothetical protein
MQHRSLGWRSITSMILIGCAVCALFYVVCMKSTTVTVSPVTSGELVFHTSERTTFETSDHLRGGRTHGREESLGTFTHQTTSCALYRMADGGDRCYVLVCDGAGPGGSAGALNCLANNAWILQ